MTNPYQVLGVAQNADMEEIKKAYRKLSRIYHPDANINNPNQAQAEAKFKEIQAAYRQITQERERGYSAYGGQQEDFGGFGSFYGFGKTARQQQSEEARYLQAAENYIRSRHFREACQALQNVPPEERSARWYYTSAMANAGAGNNITAKEHAGRAVALAPNQTEYVRLYRQLESGEAWYTERGSGYGRAAVGLGGCMECMLLYCLCGCC